jgi:L-threonylcarbamoyladenylate synthase
MIMLYPTETLYALGVNALDVRALEELYVLKERDKAKKASWLVRSIEDIERYAEVTPVAVEIATQFLPGSLTLILKAKDHISDELIASDRTIGFRISSDPVAQKLIAEFMEANDAPLTCTSANVSGSSTLSTPGEILQQFGPRASMVTKIIDDGARKGLASTIVKVADGKVEILREGEITQAQINQALRK